MIIIETSISRKAKTTTPKGRYEVEYHLINNALTRVTTTIFTPNMDGVSSYIGLINLENEIITSTLPADVKPAEYFDDFEQIMDAINEDIIEISKVNK